MITPRTAMRICILLFVALAWALILAQAAPSLPATVTETVVTDTNGTLKSPSTLWTANDEAIADAVADNFDANAIGWASLSKSGAVPTDVGATAFGASLVDDDTAADARATLGLGAFATEGLANTVYLDTNDDLYATMNAAPAGTTFLIGPGTHSLTNTLYLKSNWSIIGCGPNITTISTSPIQVSAALSVTNVFVANLSGTANNWMYIVYDASSELQNARVSGCAFSGTDFGAGGEGTWEMEVINCSITGANAFTVANASDLTLAGTVVGGTLYNGRYTSSAAGLVAHASTYPGDIPGDLAVAGRLESHGKYVLVTAGNLVTTAADLRGQVYVNATNSYLYVDLPTPVADGGFEAEFRNLLYDQPLTVAVNASTLLHMPDGSTITNGDVIGQTNKLDHCRITQVGPTNYALEAIGSTTWGPNPD